MQTGANSKIALVSPGPSPIKFLISPRRDLHQQEFLSIIIISVFEHVNSYFFFFPYCSQNFSWCNLWPLPHLSLSTSEKESGSTSPTSNHCTLGLSISIVCSHTYKISFNFIYITDIFLVNTAHIFKVIKQYGDWKKKNIIFWLKNRFEYLSVSFSFLLNRLLPSRHFIRTLCDSFYRRSWDDNHHLCIFSMDTSEIVEHSLIILFFLIFMKISKLWN